MIDTFIGQLRANDCTVFGPLSSNEARAVIRERAHGRVACNADVPVDGIDANADPARADVGVTGARIAVADPAAIALAAAPGSPRATSLLPAHHICVVRVSQLVPTLADAFTQMQADGLPSALTWIGGPSRTGDLEMVITLGVHGPRTVDVILVGA